VVMLRRPPAPPGARVQSVAAALDWLAGRLGEDGPHHKTEEETI
jgi:hypothetical protein